jgi:hypothetical protein
MAAYAAITLNNDKYTRTSIVILAMHLLWLPDDGLGKPKHVGAAFMN